MDRSDRIIAAVIFCYFAGFVLTYGHEAARFERSPDPVVSRGALFGTAAPALVWPLYWPLRLSYLAFSG